MLTDKKPTAKEAVLLERTRGAQVERTVGCVRSISHRLVWLKSILSLIPIDLNYKYSHVRWLADWHSNGSAYITDQYQILNNMHEIPCASQFFA